MKPIR
jgi:hypothetical protein